MNESPITDGIHLPSEYGLWMTVGKMIVEGTCRRWNLISEGDSLWMTQPGKIMVESSCRAWSISASWGC